MFGKALFPMVLALGFAMADFTPALSLPATPPAKAAVAAQANVEFVRGRGGGFRGGGFRGGGFRGGGMHRGYAHRGYAHRGYGHRGYRYRHGVPGRYHYGRRYYGGIWYGTGRRYWRGRWWAYGVGACWRWSPIGYVWICG